MFCTREGAASFDARTSTGELIDAHAKVSILYQELLIQDCKGQKNNLCKALGFALLAIPHKVMVMLARWRCF